LRANDIGSPFFCYTQLSSYKPHKYGHALLHFTGSLMTNLNLVFRPLPEPISNKKLLAFRKDAGWKDKIGTVYQDPRGLVQWVAVELRQHQIAIARLELAPPEFCYVADMIIKKDYRGQGVGHWFVRAIEEFCAARGIRRLVLQAAEGTNAFYESLDFHADPMVPTLLKKDIPLFRPKMLMS
jgi:GNAT superfamily N-acetyltransferase